MAAAHDTLRSGTRDEHAQVDEAYGRFDLGHEASYRSFLESHARAVLPIEGVLARSESPMQWRSRLSLLEHDLQVLGSRLPAVASLTDLKGSGERAGMLYVIEGSRLGGGVLTGRVGASLPVSYLSAVHHSGEWRALLAAFDDRAAAEPAEWLTEALGGARRAFSVFVEAAKGRATESDAN